MNAPKSVAEVLLVLGVMAYRPGLELPPGAWSTALHTFDRLVALAKSRGFRDRKSLIGGMRRGKATPFVIGKCETVCALLTEQEIRLAFASVDAWERLAGRTPWASTPPFKTSTSDTSGPVLSGIGFHPTTVRTIAPR